MANALPCIGSLSSLLSIISTYCLSSLLSLTTRRGWAEKVVSLIDNVSLTFLEWMGKNCRQNCSIVRHCFLYLVFVPVNLNNKNKDVSSSLYSSTTKIKLGFTQSRCKLLTYSNLDGFFWPCSVPKWLLRAPTMNQRFDFFY